MMDGSRMNDWINYMIEQVYWNVTGKMMSIHVSIAKVFQLFGMFEIFHDKMLNIPPKYNCSIFVS